MHRCSHIEKASNSSRFYKLASNNSRPCKRVGWTRMCCDNKSIGTGYQDYVLKEGANPSLGMDDDHLAQKWDI